VIEGTAIDHVLVAAGHDGDVEAQLLLPVNGARNAKRKLRPGGTVLFMGRTAQLLLPVNVARNAKRKVRPGGTVLFSVCGRSPISSA
jgi:hypothetical protein